MTPHRPARCNPRQKQLPAAHVPLMQSQPVMQLSPEKPVAAVAQHVPRLQLPEVQSQPDVHDCPAAASSGAGHAVAQHPLMHCW